MEFLLAFIILAVVMLIVGALYALPVMLLWNWLMPMIFHLQEITFFQAWGLVWLCGLLFKSTSTKK